MQPDPYAASCNPARRVKQQPRLAMHTISPTRNILPLPSQQPQDAAAADPPQSPHQPAKRGRKPGPLSRSAREAQRKLNHSIIEKARRTKINDALATLRQLVPANHGYPKINPTDDPEEDDGCDNYNINIKSRKDKSKGSTCKKDEKEKEFKLEILVRTVSYMQELLERVKALEERASTRPPDSCSEHQHDSGKRRKSTADDNDNDEDEDRTTNSRKRPRRRDSIDDRDQRLPSISSWLPNCDPAAVPTTNSTSSSPLALSPSTQRRGGNAPPPPPPLSSSSSPMVSHLPSPPSSAHFDPIQTPQVPPVLNLGPVASHSTIHSNSSRNYSPPLISPLRTPEDESAASMLLQISSSSSSNSASSAHDPPHHRHQHTSSPIERSSTSTSTTTTTPLSSFFHLSKMRTLCVTPQAAPPHPSPPTGSVDYHHNRRQGHDVPQAQTPGSLLGLTRRGLATTS